MATFFYPDLPSAMTSLTVIKHPMGFTLTSITPLQTVYSVILV